VNSPKPSDGWLAVHSPNWQGPQPSDGWLAVNSPNSQEPQPSDGWLAVNSPNSQGPQRGGRGATQGGESAATGPAEDSAPAAPRLPEMFGKLHRAYDEQPS